MYFPDNKEYSFGRQLPLGVWALLTLPDRNPLLYLSDPDTFRREFDFLSMYDQLNHPASLLLRPAQSPEEVTAFVSADSLTVGDGEGEALVFEEAGGPAGISKPFSPLIPPPVLSYRFSRGRFYSETGIFLASTGHSLRPGSDLKRVLMGEPVEAQSSYEFTAAASASAGISESLTYSVKLGSEDEYVLIAPRLLTYYRALMGEVKYRFRLITDEQGAVEEIYGEENIFLSRPGAGWGAGGRLDLGTSFVYRDFTLGFSLLNLLGYDYVTGVRIGGDRTSEEDTEQRSSFGPDPAVNVTASYLWEKAVFPSSKSTTILAAADAVISDGFSSHFSVTLLHKSLMLRLLAGYKGGWESAATAGLRRGNRRIALTLSLHSSPF
ncbi:MAG: hypothetical protein R6V67_09660, partial [Spirochaetia bacterium]